MSNLDPARVMLAIDAGGRELDRLQKLLGTAIDTLDEAEDAWETHYDTEAENLKTEWEEEGKKGTPPEHGIVTVARQSNREAWRNYRRAERAVKKIERQLRAVAAATNAFQSELGGLRDEAKVPQQQPAWSRRAA